MVNLTLRLLSAVCVPACKHVCERASVCESLCVPLWVCICLHWTISCKLLCWYGLLFVSVCVCVCVCSQYHRERMHVWFKFIYVSLQKGLSRYTQVTLHEEQMVLLQVGERTRAWLQIFARVYTFRLRHTGVMCFKFEFQHAELVCVHREHLRK